MSKPIAPVMPLSVKVEPGDNPEVSYVQVTVGEMQITVYQALTAFPPDEDVRLIRKANIDSDEPIPQEFFPTDYVVVEVDRVDRTEEGKPPVKVYMHDYPLYPAN